MQPNKARNDLASLKLADEFRDRAAYEVVVKCRCIRHDRAWIPVGGSGIKLRWTVIAKPLRDGTEDDRYKKVLFAFFGYEQQRFTFFGDCRAFDVSRKVVHIVPSLLEEPHPTRV